MRRNILAAIPARRTSAAIADGAFGVTRGACTLFAPSGYAFTMQVFLNGVYGVNTPLRSLALTSSPKNWTL
jgi:hypothetical protein